MSSPREDVRRETEELKREMREAKRRREREVHEKVEEDESEPFWRED